MAKTVLERYQRIAPFYDLLDWPFEHWRYRTMRPLLFEGLSGRILDAGVGTGRNLPFYPDGVDVVGIDISPRMLACAERRRNALGMDIELRCGDLMSLAFADASFSAAVAAFVFCVMPDADQPAAFRELRRVVKPGGSIRLLEYVRPSGALRAAIAGLWEPWMSWAYGAGFDRRTREHVSAAGLPVVAERFVVADLIRLIEIKIPVQT
jgi:ubiquinone/menaquinone biosynthesis C-methylase UbiE